MNSFLEASARQRITAIVDNFEELLLPSKEWTSPHLPLLNAPVSFDDGVVIGQGYLNGKLVFAAAQEGGFMGGAVGEVHGAKLVGLMRRAIAQKEENRPVALLLLAESGGVRLHEANAGLIAVSEVMRALLSVRAAGIPVIVLIGGSNGCFGGMGIIARFANWVVMSEEARLAMSGPEVIETANGVEEFDSRDRSLVWRTTGGKHRYLMGDCDMLVADDIDAFREAAEQAVQRCSMQGAALTVEDLEREHIMLSDRLTSYGQLHDPLEIWSLMGVSDPLQLALLEADAFLALAATLPHKTSAEHLRQEAL